MFAVVKTIKKVEFPTGETVSFYRYVILDSEDDCLKDLEENETVIATFINEKEAKNYRNKKIDERRKRLQSLKKRYKDMVSVYQSCYKMIEEHIGYY